VQAADVRLRTTLGDIEIDLLEEEAPVTVANFLKYISDGDFDNVFFHRSVDNFIIQSGGFTFVDGEVDPVPADPPIVNEFGISNTRGTLAMAKLSGDPDSATSGWFINLADNSGNLDNQNGGFTVFARVVGNGMAVADQIGALDRWQFNSPFGELPLIDYPGSGDVTAEHFVFVSLAADSAGDGLSDDENPFPDDPSNLDTDGAGTPDNLDSDDDGDGIPDTVELDAGLDPLDASDAAGDLDGDNHSNLQEYLDGTDMTDPRSNMTTTLVIIKLLLGGSSVEEDE